MQMVILKPPFQRRPLAVVQNVDDRPIAAVHQYRHVLATLEASSHRTVHDPPGLVPADPWPTVRLSQIHPEEQAALDEAAVEMEHETGGQMIGFPHHRGSDARRHRRPAARATRAGCWNLRPLLSASDACTMLSPNGGSHEYDYRSDP